MIDDLYWWGVTADARDQRAMWRDLRRVLTDDEWSRYVGQSVTRRGVIWTHEHLILPNRARRYT